MVKLLFYLWEELCGSGHQDDGVPGRGSTRYVGDNARDQ